MPRINHGSSGGGGGARWQRVLSDEQRRELLAQCRRECRPDLRVPFRGVGGWISYEQERRIYREWDRLQEQAERDAQALFEERLRRLTT